jgi:hypothetical protein
MIYFLALVAVATLLLIPGWYWKDKHGTKGIAILALPSANCAFWFVLIYFGVGQASLSNLVEIFAVAAFAVVCGYLKFFVFDNFTKIAGKSTVAAFTLALLFSLALRLLMPALPE